MEEALWQREDGERATEVGVLLEASVATNSTQTIGRVRQASSKTDTGPATNAREHGNVLLATVRVSHGVADDARRRLELEEFLAILLVDGFEVAFERAVEGNAASGGQSARPDRELLRLRPDDLALRAVPGDEVTHTPWLSGAGNMESVAPT